MTEENILDVNCIKQEPIEENVSQSSKMCTDIVNDYWDNQNDCIKIEANVKEEEVASEKEMEPERSKSPFPVREFTEDVLLRLSADSYQCQVCSRMYTNKAACRRHAILHFKPKLHGCNVCGKKFHAPYVLKRHYVTHTGEKSYKCDICGKMFAQMGHLHGHLVTHEKTKKFECAFCGNRFVAKVRLRKHIFGVHFPEKADIECTICHKVFSKYSTWRMHRFVHFNRKPYTCHFCGKTFTWRHGIYVHMKQHLFPEELTTLQCYTCKETFEDRDSLQQHLNAHTTHKRVFKTLNICETCDETFENRLLLYEHLSKYPDHHPSVLSNNLFTCIHCNRRFTHKIKFLEHTCTSGPHAEYNQYYCKICNKRYASKRYFSDHMKVHEGGKKQFSCRLCGKVFANKSGLARHGRSHTGEQPYTCEFCGRKFSQRSNCRKHCLTHLGLKKSYGCEICGRRFSERANLVRHYPIHDSKGGRSYVCHLCGVTFRHPAPLKVHQVASHPKLYIKRTSSKGTAIKRTKAIEKKKEPFESAMKIEEPELSFI